MAMNATTPIDLSGATLYVQNIKTGFNKSNSVGSVDRFGNLAGGSATTLTSVNAGQWVNMDTASGTTLTLPSATGSGNIYQAYVGTTVTSNNHIFKTNGTDTMIGTLSLIGTTNLFVILSGTNKTITMNGTTTGGIKGTTFWAQDIGANLWLVEAVICGSGTVTTPVT